MERRGYSQQFIADKLGISQPQVWQIRKRIKERCRTSMLKDREAYVKKKLQELSEVRSAAWEAYELSKATSTKVVEEFVRPYDEADEKPKRRKNRSIDQDLERLKKIVTTEGRLPGNQYLNVVLETIKQERELLGLDAPKEIDHTVTTTVVSWDALLESLVDPLAVDREIIDVEPTPAPATSQPQLPLLEDQETPPTEGSSHAETTSQHLDDPGPEEADGSVPRAR